MKKLIFALILGIVSMFYACNRQHDTLIGSWTVDKVNVQFDEKHNTPELVKQIGEMERQNSFNINADSILSFKGLDTEWQGKIHLRSDGTLICNGANFGVWKEGQVVTRTGSPLGEVIVTYRKKQLRK